MHLECRICGNADNNSVYTAAEMMFGTREEFDYFECSSCGTVQIARIPDLSLFYPDNYYSFETATEDGLRLRIGRFLAHAYLRAAKGGPAAALPFLAKAFPSLDIELGFLDMGLGLASVLRSRIGPDCRILDVGSGDGKLLGVLADLGFKSLLGADAFISADRILPGGVRILKRELKDVEGEFDLIMFHHSFEHLTDPAGTLRTVGDKLSKGGRCLIRIPIASHAWEKYGTNWVGLDPPRHLHLFSERAFRSLAEREGFAVEDVTYDSTSFQFCGSEQYQRGIPLFADGHAPLQFTRRQLGEWKREARRLNAEGRGDQAAFLLRPE